MRQTVVDKERENRKKRKKEIERKEINKKSGKIKKRVLWSFYTFIVF